MDVLLQFPANGSHKLVAPGENAVLYFKNLLPEFALRRSVSCKASLGCLGTALGGFQTNIDLSGVTAAEGG